MPVCPRQQASLELDGSSASRRCQKQPQTAEEDYKTLISMLLLEIDWILLISLSNSATCPENSLWGGKAIRLTAPRPGGQSRRQTIPYLVSTWNHDT
eukprot:750163-Hanusia_phi.AAC.4